MKLFFIVLSLIFTKAGFSQSQEYRIKNFNLKDGLAIKGYDPVAYFKENKAVKGKEGYDISFRGVRYLFYSKANLGLFNLDPMHYEPQFGGWCAYAMGSDGSKVEIDPSTFKISNGKLYLFYNRFFNSTLNSWNSDEIRLRSKAEENWMKLFKPY